MNLRMLPDIQRVQMQSEGAHLQNQWVNQRARNAQPAIVCQRLAQRLQVVDELLDIAISGQHLRQLVLSLRQRIRHHR